MSGDKLAVAAALLLLLPACAPRDAVGAGAETTAAGTEGVLLPGVFDFPAVPGSTVQTPCNIEVEEQAPGALCVEFPTADSERIMAEYRRRLMQSGWSEASLPPELVGANLTLEFRRADPSDGCTFSFYPLVYDKTEMPTDVLGGGPSAWAAHRNAPGHQSVLRLAVEKLDYSRPNLVCESSGGAQ
ncbi:MAG: hypothetical protein KJZ75_00340 [Hyphomonadaceae bacterium]|nr:hypothetical protein [Hyphomonadaceae bacterium]